MSTVSHQAQQVKVRNNASKYERFIENEASDFALIGRYPALTQGGLVSLHCDNVTVRVLPMWAEHAEIFTRNAPGMVSPSFDVLEGGLALSAIADGASLADTNADSFTNGVLHMRYQDTSIQSNAPPGSEIVVCVP